MKAEIRAKLDRKLKPKQVLPPALEAAKWKPGQSGNPSGRPKTKVITDFYARILSKDKNLKIFEKAIIKAVGEGRMAGVFQLREMTDRTEGKVTNNMHVDGELALTISDRMRKARERLGE